MLRLLVLLLLLANGLYYGWTQGFFKTYGWAPAETSEPHRLQQQIKPEALSVLASDSTQASNLDKSSTNLPTECLKSAWMEEGRLDGVRRALSVLPAGTWQVEGVTEPARWSVYMGKFPNPEAQAKKRAELERMNLKLVPVQNLELEPGLSLGGYGTQSQAEEALAVLQKRGVRTARVVLERDAAKGGVLTLSSVDDALRARLDALKPALGNLSLNSCK